VHGIRACNSVSIVSLCVNILFAELTLDVAVNFAGHSETVVPVRTKKGNRI